MNKDIRFGNNSKNKEYTFFSFVKFVLYTTAIVAIICINPPLALICGIGFLFYLGIKNVYKDVKDTFKETFNAIFKSGDTDQTKEDILDDSNNINDVSLSTPNSTNLDPSVDVSSSPLSQSV